MPQTPRSRRGMVTAPHHLASEAGLRVLRDGGNAVEAAVAAAATLAVVYPHMTGIGGDGFWLIAEPDCDPVAIDASGAAGLGVSREIYGERTAMPWRGPLAANTVAGTVSGWDMALGLAAHWGPPLPLSRLFEDAIHYAERGFAVSASQAELTAAKFAELSPVSGFAEQFLDDGRPPAEGGVMRLATLGGTLRRLGKRGLEDFYHGETARMIAEDLMAAGSPLTAEDLTRHAAKIRLPLQVPLREARLFNTPAPTQGLASLAILALFERLHVEEAEGFAHLHGLVEATKQAFLLRDRVVTDPAFAVENPQSCLAPDALDRLADAIDPRRALPWPAPPAGGDTVWLGVIDAAGRAVSMIQSVYFEFGSGLVLPQTGITWQNRGTSFSLAPEALNALTPGRKPFHTLNPAMARFTDGRTLVYGTMGGEGQPQTQAAIFSRYAFFRQTPQQAVTAPRWLLGRTWGEDSVSLKLESRFDPGLVDALRMAGHAIEMVPAFTSQMGHAGMIVRRPDGMLEGATDPRSDGAVAAY
ncbi:gamma-glutamyltransferase family protein [Telmatospirillum siberiense]|uniref:Gamma-glutamyltransferase n=1 Tax=Telmatospirillum siberiense TaxID=382514 RepID=A0A2N3PYP4_9PROT|nr:gamma-glutamyltransferase family protein [Telmatospirillum siberiense]PKU25509.1 gamma-glutamyltransferase [Telmatospirillum siberiense]